jgi:transposase
MDKPTSNQTSRKAPQGRGGKASTESVTTASPEKPYELIKLGVDTHGGQYTFARMIDNLGSQPPQKLTPEAFLQFLQKQLKLARRVVMVYEAGPYGFALYRQATAMGVECHVCAPERLSRGRKRVNDKIDARELLNRLDRHLAGNTAALRLVRVPTLEQELSRRQARERNTYRKERQRWIGRGRSLLHTLGICRPGHWWEAERYAALRQSVQSRYGPSVAERIGAELDHYLELLELIQRKLTELTAALQQAAKQNPQPRVKGIGALSSELLDREIGDWNRFQNRRQVASYTGLCPGEESSGDTQMNLSIDKHGNPRLRAVLVECAWLLPRYQPAYKALQRWKEAFAPASKAGRSQRKKAVVALGRRLAVDLWRLKTGRASAEDLGLALR